MAYSVGAPSCPQCGSTEYVEQGSEEHEAMAKITKHGGPSDVTQDAPADSAAPPTTSSPPGPEVFEVPEYDAWTVEGLRDELAERDLPKTGNKAELVLRLQADDKENARPADADGADGTERS